MNAIDKCEIENWFDADGNPHGGFVRGVGLDIQWQQGPLGRGEERIEPNGAFVETVLQAVAKRLEHYQSSKFNCQENATALDHVSAAIDSLQSRTKAREARDVEGTLTV